MPDDVIWGVPRKASWVKITAVIPAEVFIVWDEVRERLAEQGITHGNEPVRNGMILEILAAEFLAGKR
jgi:hypothetical protein